MSYQNIQIERMRSGQINLWCPHRNDSVEITDAGAFHRDVDDVQRALNRPQELLDVLGSWFDPEEEEIGDAAAL